MYRAVTEVHTETDGSLHVCVREECSTLDFVVRCVLYEYTMLIRHVKAHMEDLALHCAALGLATRTNLVGWAGMGGGG